MNRLIVVLLLLGVSACSTPVTLGSAYSDSDRKMVTPKFSELIFYTPAYLGRKTYYQVSVDGKAVGPLGGKSYFAHASKPGSLTVSAKKVNAGETALLTTLTILSMGATYGIARRDLRNRANPVPLDIVAEEGATRYLGVGVAPALRPCTGTASANAHFVIRASSGFSRAANHTDSQPIRG